MNRRAFLKACAALLVAAGAYPERVSALTWDLSKEYGWMLPYTDDRTMLWAAEFLKKNARKLVPPGKAELRVKVPDWYEFDKGVAIYWHPRAMQHKSVEKHDKPKWDDKGGYYLLERFVV